MVFFLESGFLLAGFLVGLTCIVLAIRRRIHRNRVIPEVDYFLFGIFIFGLLLEIYFAYPFFYKERANLTEREMMPRTVGYRQLEAGPTGMIEISADQSAILAAAAAVLADPPASGRPLYSLYSEESLTSSSADDDGSVGQANDFPGYESIEMRVLKCTVTAGHPAILSVGSSQTVDL